MAELRWMSVSRDGVYRLMIDDRAWTVPASSDTQVRIQVDGPTVIAYTLP